jgi:phosphatidylethanolamine/phosphatidyl-N-methylethanolamine N-methyltransferase
VTLREMDGCDLQFEDNTFDYVIAMFVVSVVPDPVKLVKEMMRVTKNSGHMIIVNHFLSPNPLVAKVEEILCPLTRWIGWRSDLDLDLLIQETRLEVRDNYKLRPFDLWRFVFAVNNK